MGILTQKGTVMFLNEKEKSLKSRALESLMGKIDEMDNSKLGGKKPVAAEVAITEVQPVEGEEEESELGEYMKEAGHEGVEAEEAKLFPAEEAKEEAMTVSPEQKMMIEELYNKFVR
jgi:hypothetical protein